ncbi:3-oxoacyl-[acyl-carrier-protein] reductase [Aerococcaceae bacterium INB8]|uniref:3-oxoacyl-[acyl-carrier-protein] reductase n=1 Tax=Ruoffia halotolerans TaxID=2748684 RepID=A0A839A545_9LACT|nr:3-oxoacyl-[acyl-carrier-protein] reductase [Ruoffia halotolerans]MBA5728833.1 3-oxoacyl-[acyl-carrier-protein] reductase [Ruoffia halotolerans]
MTLTCLISGSSRGIGLGIAKHLAEAGHQVILNSRKPIAEKVLQEFADYELEVGQAIGDISNFDGAKKLVEEVRETYGRIDVLINNAGITSDGLFLRMTEEDFDNVINTNLKGTFNLTRFVSPIMLKQKSGTIINMSSVVGVTGNPGQANYAASKAGVIGLTKSLAKELGSRSITVNAIAPGYIETDMTDALSDKVKKTMLSHIPLKRFGQVEEISSVVDFLITNRYITGQVIEVNGGLHI